MDLYLLFECVVQAQMGDFRIVCMDGGTLGLDFQLHGKE
jgi:hypothetical protein